MKINVYLLLLLISCGMHLQFVQAQHKNIFSLTQSPFKQGEKYFRQGDYMTAITFYEKALQKDRRKQGIMKLRMANSYRLLHHTKEAELWYKDIMNTKSIVGQQDVLNYAQVLLSNGKYEASKAWFEHYNKEYGVDTLALKKIEGINQLSVYYEDSVTRPVQRVSINTVYSEFCPVFYDKGIIFTSSRQSASMVKLNNTKNNHAFLDLYYSELNADKSLSDPKPWHHAASSAYHEGPITFYSDQTKGVFTQNFSLHKKQEKTDTRHLGLFSIEKTGENKWSDAVALPFNNIHYSVAHAAVTSTGEAIYFSSNMPGGYGGTDLYVVHHQEGTWSTPVNLGTTINTSGNELFPSLFQDSILYFSSTGQPGLGGLDIYRTRVHNSHFSSPEILGYPINSNQDDFGIVFDKGHKSGYLSSNRTNGGSDDDLFSFEILNVYLKGSIKAKLKNLPLNDVLVRMTVNGAEVLSTKTDEQGNFFFTLEPSEDYTLTAYKENFKILYNSFSTKNRGASDTIQQEFVLEKEVKTVVKGIVNQNNSAVPLLKIMALETKTLHLDTLLSDDRGEFFFEADPGLEYFFYVDTRSAFGEVLLEPSKKTKGTFLLYTKIELHNYDTAFVNVQVKDGNLPATNALVLLENTVTRKMDSLYTNKKGVIRFIAKSYTNYNISSLYKKKTASLYDFNLLTNRMRTLVLHLKEEE